MDKHYLNSLILSVVTAAVVSSLIFFFGMRFAGVDPSSQDMMNGRDMAKTMKEMMGDEREEQISLKIASERKERLEPALKNGVKEFSLTAEPIRSEYANGKTILAWGYNGQIPGPEIRVTEGDRVKIVFTNKLPKATTIHWHGVDVPNDQDGVPGVTQKAIKPGETYTYEFIAKPAGTRMYHTHGGVAMGDEAQQLDMGLSGAFIIEPVDHKKPDREYTLILDEWQTMPMSEAHKQHSSMMNAGIMMDGGHMMDYNLFTINGRSFPDTEPLKVKNGERVRLRMINGGTSTIHPMHLHGHQFKIVAVDGNEVPSVAQLTRNTLPIHPGETYDIEFVANNPGTWLFHCHELHHADAGMIVPIVYE
ncbi:MAG: multicopper oxidase domain-containing protein [bacterium]|nr:multicopper oxidase domain-containing protein [bacterium]